MTRPLDYSSLLPEVAMQMTAAVRITVPPSSTERLIPSPNSIHTHTGASGISVRPTRVATNADTRFTLIRYTPKPTAHVHETEEKQPEIIDSGSIAACGERCGDQNSQECGKISILAAVGIGEEFGNNRQGSHGESRPQGQKDAKEIRRQAIPGII